MARKVVPLHVEDQSKDKLHCSSEHGQVTINIPVFTTRTERSLSAEKSEPQI